MIGEKKDELKDDFKVNKLTRLFDDISSADKVSLKNVNRKMEYE